MSDNEQKNLYFDNLFNKIQDNLSKSQERVEKLEANNKDLESFSYSVSHELKNHIRHLLGNIDLLKKETLTIKYTKDGLEYLKNVEYYANKLADIVKSLLSLSHLGPAYFNMKVTDLNQILNEILEGISIYIKKEVIWNISNLPTLLTDPTMIQIVFTNLIDNAIKFNNKKSIKVTIEYSENESEHVFFINDNGMGFHKEDSSRLFNLFNRLENAQRIHGNGLGLVTIRRIITSLGGQVWAEGKLNHGSTFYFSLPK
jgi:chemotaxis family two-component system sensor kinase Cph1